MRKVKQIFFTIILMILCTMKVRAVENFPKKIDVTFDTTLNYTGSSIVHKILPDGIDVYCLDWGLVAPVRECRLMEQQGSEAKYAGLAALIDSVNDKDNKEYYFASIAVHFYIEGSYGHEAPGDRAKAQPYIDIAKATEKKVKGFNLNVSDDSYDFIQQGDYFVSNDIKVNAVYADDYRVELNNTDAEVINKDEDSFQIRIPVSNIENNSNFEIEATITATQTYLMAARYECDAMFQRVAPDILKPVTKEKTVAITLAVNKTEPTPEPEPDIPSTKLQISKQDITTNEELEGATLQILDANENEIKDEQGNVLYKWVSTKTPHYIEDLAPGKYYLVETIAPNGYILNEEKIEFELKDDGKLVSVVMQNTKAPVVEVPSTGYNTSLFLLSIGIIVIVSGLTYIGLNVRKQN